MPRYIAFLRAINVGGHTVKMDHLRALFEAFGFANVETFIASGNVIFDASPRSVQTLEGEIERGLLQALGYEVATFLRSVPEVAAIAGYRPFVEIEPGHGSMYIAFLQKQPTERAREALMSFRGAIDDFHVHGREVYWRCRANMSESTFSGALLEKTLQAPATIRNVTTVTKLAAKYAGGVL